MSTLHKIDNPPSPLEKCGNVSAHLCDSQNSQEQLKIGQVTAKDFVSNSGKTSNDIIAGNEKMA